MRRHCALRVLCVVFACVVCGSVAGQGLEGAPPVQPPNKPPPRPRPIDPAIDTGLLMRPDVQTGDEWIYRRSSGRSRNLTTSASFCTRLRLGSRSRSRNVGQSGSRLESPPS